MPELIIEVLPPNLTDEERAEWEQIGPLLSRQEIESEREIAMRTGCLQFWIVDHEDRRIEVTDTEGTQTYLDGSTMTLPPPWNEVALEVSTLLNFER